MYTVLAICAHPDDNEAYCGGTLIKCVERGDRVVACHLSDGDMGHVVIEPEVLGKMRCEEAKAAGKKGGYEVIWGGFHDISIYSDNKEARDKVVDIIRRVNPDFIITHNPNDYMPDHTATSRLVFDASFAATVPHYKTSVDTPAKLVPIFYMDYPECEAFVPEYYVDISDVQAKKEETIESHASQLVWLREHDNIDFPAMMRTCAANRGYQCGVQYAEGFTMCKAYLKGTTKRLLP